MVDKYQIVHHHNKVILIPLADSLVYVYTFSNQIYFLPKSTLSYPQKKNNRVLYLVDYLIDSPPPQQGDSDAISRLTGLCAYLF